MLGGAQIFLNFIELARVDDVVGRLLPVYRLGVQRGVYLGESHRCGIRSERVEYVDKDGILDGANLQSAEVFQFGNRAFAIAGMPESDFPVAKTGQALVGEFVQQLLSHWPIENRVSLFLLGKKKRQVEQAKLLYRGPNRRRGNKRHFKNAPLSPRDRLKLGPELTVGVAPYLDLACGLLADELRKPGHAQVKRAFLCRNVADLDRAVFDVGCAGGEGEASQGQWRHEGCPEQALVPAVHFKSPLSVGKFGQSCD